MLTYRRFPFHRAFFGSWKLLTGLAAYGALLCVAHLYFDLGWLALPVLPVSLLGTAVSFYLGFKGNSAYDRLWEARKIWGGIVNTSRTWGIHVTGMVVAPEPDLEEGLKQVHQQLIYRHVAWLGALRTQLRRSRAWEHNRPSNNRARASRGTLDQSPERLRSRIVSFMSQKEVEETMGRKNQATHILKLQSEALLGLMENRYIDDFRHMELAKLLATMFTLQGKCERIKNFPLPRQYATANHWFVSLFVLSIPMTLVGVFDNAQPGMIWWTIPISMVLGWAFTTWNMIVDFSENPFEGIFMDIPIDALSRTIEIDLREMLGEQELPEPVKPAADGALM